MRIASAIVGGIALMSVAACSGDGTEPTAGSAPKAAETTAAAAAEPADDKAMCAAADKAAKATTKAIVTLVSTGAEPAPADYAKILTDMNAALTSAVQGDSAVATAMKEVAA